MLFHLNGKRLPARCGQVGLFDEAITYATKIWNSASRLLRGLRIEYCPTL